MWKKRILALIILILGVAVGFFVFKSEPKLNKNFTNEKSFFKSHPFRLGLDLSGGSHLTYKADVSGVPAGQVSDSMNALRDVIERRVNLFGVSEPVVQVQEGGFASGGNEKLIVDLPGVTDVEKATAMIGQTPLLVFETEAPATPQKVTVGADGKEVNKLAAFLEVDTRNLDDIKRTIADCGVAYVGVKIPKYLYTNPFPAVWDVQTENDELIGAHAVILAGYDAQGAKVISFGQFYTMTWAFFSQYADEAYALADSAWIEAKGSSPGGLDLAALRKQMRAISGS